MESKIQCFRVRALFYYLYLERWLVSFPSSLFPSPINHLRSLLKALPPHIMSLTPFTITIPTNTLQYEEVWGIDNKDFYDGLDALVHVVKCSWICHELTLTL